MENIQAISGTSPIVLFSARSLSSSDKLFHLKRFTYTSQLASFSRTFPRTLHAVLELEQDVDFARGVKKPALTPWVFQKETVLSRV